VLQPCAAGSSRAGARAAGGPVVAWSLDDAATACKHEPRIVREHARKRRTVWQGQLIMGPVKVEYYTN